jgi:aromatic-L-amino-acid decarboxylase
VVPRRRRLRRLRHIRTLAEAEVPGPRAGRLVHPRPAQVVVHTVRLLRVAVPGARAGPRHTHTQDASYLDVIHTSDGEWNPSDYAYHLTRRARGLPLWFSLAVYGLDAYRQAIEVAASLAVQTAELIKAAPQLELIREPDLGVVLFRRLGWKPEDYDAWAQRLHQDQVAFIPPTKWEGETVGRFAFLHPDTSLELVREVLARTE